MIMSLCVTFAVALIVGLVGRRLYLTRFFLDPASAEVGRRLPCSADPSSG